MIEVVRLTIDNYGIKVNGELITDGFLDYEAESCKDQLELLDPELLNKILKSREAKSNDNLQGHSNQT